MSDDAPETTDFGYQQVPRDEKAQRVGEVFRSVAGRYDLMNDLMSLGLHRLWKRQALHRMAPRPGQHWLDLAAGTGDLSRALSRRVGERGRVVAADISAPMLELGRDRLTDAGVVGNVDFVLADAEQLPFADRRFDGVCIGFGLRNVTDKAAALADMARVIRPGGRLVVLEFSQVYVPALRPLYDAYSLHLLPRLGQAVADDADSYRYLAESIRMHPDQETLKGMLEDAGFEDCDYVNLSAGVVAIHTGFVF